MKNVFIILILILCQYSFTQDFDKRMDDFYKFLGEKKSEAFKELIDSYDEFLKLNFDGASQGQRTIQFIKYIDTVGIRYDSCLKFNIVKGKQAIEKMESSGMRKEIWLRENENYSRYKEDDSLLIVTFDIEEEIVPIIRNKSDLNKSQDSHVENKNHIEFNSFGLYLNGLRKIQDIDTVIEQYCEAKYVAGAISPQLMINGLLGFKEETLEKPYVKFIMIAEFYLFLLEREIKNSSAPNNGYKT